MTPPRILLLPGWQGAAASHWQSHWERRFGFELLQQDDWWWPRRGDWMARLEDALLADERPTVLVAHGLACQLVAAWAGHSRHGHRVVAGLLVAPPDLLRVDLAPQLTAWAPLAMARLAFPSTVVTSVTDPHCQPEHSRSLALAWGSEIHDAGAAGSLDAGLGDWPAGLSWLGQLMRRAGLPRSPPFDPPGPG